MPFYVYLYKMEFANVFCDKTPSTRIKAKNKESVACFCFWKEIFFFSQIKVVMRPSVCTSNIGPWTNYHEEDWQFDFSIQFNTFILPGYHIQ